MFSNFYRFAPPILFCAIGSGIASGAEPLVEVRLAHLMGQASFGLSHVRTDERGYVVQDARQHPDFQTLAGSPWVTVVGHLSHDFAIGLDYLGVSGTGGGNIRARQRLGPLSYLVPAPMFTRYNRDEAYLWGERRFSFTPHFQIRPRLGVQWSRMQHIEASAPKVQAEWKDRGHALMPALGIAIDWVVDDQWRVSFSNDYSAAHGSRVSGTSRSSTLEVSHPISVAWRLHAGVLQRSMAIESSAEYRTSNVNWQLQTFYVQASWRL